MQRREVDSATIEHIIEEGEIKRRDGVNLWIYKQISQRADNSICLAVAEEAALVIKTVMINWELEDEA
jgi:hypothetical protein